jgi:ADP-heptose:LPS heptosyltransferase
MIPWRKQQVAHHPAPVNAKRVLVVKLGSLGEFIQSLAAAKLIRNYHVGARITLLTTPELKELAEKCPYFDVVDPGGKPAEPQAITQLIARIRAAKYEMVYDLENSNRTSNYYHGLRPWPPLWSGVTAGASHVYSDPDRDRLHPLERLTGQLAAAGLVSAHPLAPDLTWLRAALRDPPRLQPDYFGVRGRYVLLLPRGTSDTPKNKWPENKYIEIAYRIAAAGVTPVVLGGSEERELGATIVRAEPRAKNLVARADLFQSIALAERSSFTLGDDVDLMHLAAASGASCLVLLSSQGDPERTTPRGKGGVIALTASVVADIPVDQVERQLRNCGVYRQAATA